jgi:hypothetical protein
MPSSFSSMLEQMNETTITNHILAIQGFGPHPTGSQALKDLENYLLAQISLPGLVIQQLPWHSKLRSGDTIQASIVGVTHPNDIVIVCAHYDCNPISPGADDDGSGVAALLTMAQVMRQYLFNCTIRFLFFSGEEQGLLGSTAYAKDADKQNENVLGVLALDGVGYANESVNGTHTLWNNADPIAYWIVHRAEAVAAQYPDLVGLTIGLGNNHPDSDHQAFLDVGYSAECFREETLDPFYHTTNDTIDYMNLRYLTGVTRLAAGTIGSMAGLNRTLRSNQIIIRMRGTLRSSHGFFTVNVSNLGYAQDTANLTVHVALKNHRTGQDLVFKNVTLNWTLSPEVGQFWRFEVGARKFPIHFADLIVTVFGRGDDDGLYQYEARSGIIFLQRYLVLLP